jgi:hypothetical protein
MIWKLLTAVVVALVILSASAFAAPKNYPNNEHVTCEGVIKRDPDSGTWLDSTRMCSQTFWQDLERVLEACPEGSRCKVTAIIIDDKHRYGFGRVLDAIPIRDGNDVKPLGWVKSKNVSCTNGLCGVFDYCPNFKPEDGECEGNIAIRSTPNGKKVGEILNDSSVIVLDRKHHWVFIGRKATQ